MDLGVRNELSKSNGYGFWGKLDIGNTELWEKVSSKNSFYAESYVVSKLAFLPF